MRRGPERGLFFVPMKLIDEILDQKDKAVNYLATKRTLWDSYENIFHNKLDDSISAKQKSQVFDPKLSTLVLDRGYRVMAQLPTGKVKPMTTNDIGATKLMNLTLDRYILPNANAQFDFLTKLRMIDIYSNIYGNFFSLIDWDVKPNGYIGPDMWLIPIRDVFPQVGAVSVDDSDEIIIRTWRPLSFFKNLSKQQGYKNISNIIDILKDKAGSKEARDSNSISQRETKMYPEQQAAKGMGYYEVLTRFEKDRWVDICVDAKLDFRDQKNPHENGELPVACKYSIPLLDDQIGMGDFERGYTMQQTINSIWNLYLDACKMSIFPPILVNKDNIASMSSIKWGAAEKWLVRNQISNAVSPIQLTPQGIATFNNTYQVANAALLNMFGTTDTTTTQQTDAGFGKTPRALQMQQQRENARDNADRFYMEQFLVKVIKKMVNLQAKKQTSALTLRLFQGDVDQLAKDYPEIVDSYDQKKGTLTIDKKKTGSVLYDYEIVPGSTYAVDQQSQQQNLQGLLDLFMKAQTPQGNFIEARLAQEGYDLKFGEIFKRIISNSGIQDWDKIVVEKSQAEKTQATLDQHAQQFQQALQMMQGGGLNQVPPQPGQQPTPPQGMPMQGAPPIPPQAPMNQAPQGLPTMQ